MAVKLADAFVQITARSEGLQKDVAKQLAGLGKVGESAGKDIGESMSSEIGKASEKANEEIVKATEKASKEIGKKIKKPIEEAGKESGKSYAKQFAKEAQSSLGGLGDKIMGGLGKTLKVGAIGVGVAAGGALAGALTKGMGRLQALDQAEAKLKGLGFTGDEIARSMEGVNKSVKGTAFGLDEAAGSAAKLTGVGVAVGDELDRSLTLTADIAAQAGTSMDDISSIMAKVAGGGKLTGETLAQLEDRATGASGALADHLGVSIEEVRKQVSEGAIDFETFQAAMEGHIGGAAQATGETFQGSMDNMMSALGRFGAKLLDPVFSSAPAVFGAVGGAFDTLGEKLEPVIEQFGEWLAPKVEEFAENLGPWLEETVENVATAFGDLSKWLKENKTWLEPVMVGLGAMAGVIGGIAVAMSAWNKGIVVYEAVTKIANGTTKLFNNTLKTNVIILVVAALAALVAGLVYFFTQTETGREVWSKFTTALGAGWDWVTEKLSAGWAWIQENVFNAFGRKMDELSIWWKNTTGQLAAAWQDVQMVFSAVWEAIKTAVFDAWNWYVNQVKSNWEMVTSALNSAWTFVKDTFTSVWNTIKTAVFDAWNAYVDQVKANWDTVTNALNTAWTWVKDTFTNTWNAIKTGVFDAWNNVVDGVKSTWERITTSISDKWTWLKDQLHTVWRWVDDNVFEKMKSALTVVKDSFGTAADGIKVLWDRVRAAAAAPIRFVVDTVVNKGLIGAWNKVTGWVGLDPVDTIPLGELGSYATGTSRVPGPRSVGRDNMRFISVDGRHAINLAGQEGIAHQHVVDAIGTHNWDRLNAAAVTGGAPAVRRELGSFAGGGVVGSITGLVNRYFPMMTITSTYRNTNDHHGAGRAVDFSNGTDTTPQMQAAAAWFAQNYGSGLLELIHSPSPYNIKNGQSVGDGFGFYGAGTMNGHRNHVHVAAPAPLGPPGTPPPDLGDLPAGGFFDLGGMVKGLWDKAIGAIGKWDGGGLIGELPAAFAKSAASKLWDFISEKITLFDTGGVWKSGTAGVNLSGADEYVFTNRAMRDFQQATESLQVVAEEIGAAFNGGDWGMGELASYIGIELAESTINVVAAIGKADRGFREWAESETVTEARRKFEGDSRDALIGGGRSLAVESLDLVGLGAVVDIAEGVGGKIHGIMQDEEVREAVKKVQLDPDMSYSGREVEKKLRELGVDVERIKSQLSGGVLGGLVGMA